MKYFLLLYVCLIYVFAAMPLVQLSTDVIPRRSLRGLRVPKRPEPTLSGFLDGSFQDKAQRWFLRGHGFWGYLVRLEHQFNFKVFGQLSSNYNAGILLGNNDALFQSLYLKSFNRREVPTLETVDYKVSRIARLQELLKEHNIPMLLFISTNKLALYPEDVPKALQDPTRLTRKNSYQLMKPLLKKYRVNTFDAHEYLSERKKNADIKFFPPTGSHWNDVVACSMTAEILKRAEQLLGRSTAHFTCSPVKVVDKPRHTDLDLASVANLWDPTSLFHPVPYPVTKKISNSDAFRPRLLLVGTSFLRAIIRFLEYHEAAYGYFIFYFNEIRAFPGGGLERLNKSKIKIDGYDMVLLEANQAILSEIGFGFVEFAISQLEGLRDQR